MSSVLVKSPEGELLRVDTLEAETEQVTLPGEALCRWIQLFKPKMDGGREEAEALKLTADNLFLNLFEGEAEGELSLENAELKLFLALMLERRRVLKAKGRTLEYSRYVHRPSKREFLVPAVDLDPSFFLENEAKLSLIFEGGAEEPAPEGTADA